MQNAYKSSANNQHLCLWVICQQILAASGQSWWSCCCFGQATRCQAGCNIKQHALTMNGRTPATKATTKRLPLTAFPLFSASYMTPAPSWKKISAPLLWTRCQSLERAQKQLSQIEHQQAEIEGGLMEEGTTHLPVNLDEVFLSGKALEEGNNKHWSEGQRIKPRQREQPDGQESCLGNPSMRWHNSRGQTRHLWDLTFNHADTKLLFFPKRSVWMWTAFTLSYPKYFEDD